jgi:hypothetical protein
MICGRLTGLGERAFVPPFALRAPRLGESGTWGKSMLARHAALATQSRAIAAFQDHAMSHYSLIFRADGSRPDKRIEFHGEDPSRALLLAHREKGDRPAELWKDGEKLCTIRRVGDPKYWMIEPAGEAPPDRPGA